MMALMLLIGSATQSTGAPATAPLILAEQGASRAAIVVAPDATDAENHAAAELARYLNEVTGGTFPIAGAAEPGRSRLLVGPGAAKLADPNFATDGLGAEGIVLVTTGNDLILCGGRPRGTLYAVYTFLADHVGCRWWTSKAAHIPRRPDLRVGPLNVRYVPRLEYREPFWFDAFDGDWAVRNRCNGHRANIDAARGGKQVYEGFVHTFHDLIPPDKYFQDHPEWFSEIKGRRTHEHAQLCLTNEEMRAELVRRLKNRLRKNPAATIASVSQNDCLGNCECPHCAALDKAEGSPAGSLLHFVNAVAAEIEPEFPHVAIDTLAYQYTRKPPGHVRPRPNVIVRLCSIECAFGVPLADERNRAFRDDLDGWSQRCDRLYVWDYTTNFRHYILPHPNLRVLGPNIELFVNHGVRGVFEQGAYQSPGAEMAELRAWVLAQLLWDPTRDARALRDEFLAGYYGPAAEPIRAYLELMHDAVAASGDALGCYSPADAPFLSYATLSTGLERFRQAEAAAGDDADLRRRVQVAELPLLYTFLVRWEPLRKEAASAGAGAAAAGTQPAAGPRPWPLESDIRAVYQRFMSVARAEQITRISEGQPIEALRGIVEQAASRPAP